MGNVRGYYRRDGTYVRPHYRRSPIRGTSGGGLILLIIAAAWLLAGDSSLSHLVDTLREIIQSAFNGPL